MSTSRDAIAGGVWVLFPLAGLALRAGVERRRERIEKHVVTAGVLRERNRRRPVLTR